MEPPPPPPPPQLKGVVIITLPPEDNPSLGKTITSIFTLADPPPPLSPPLQQSQTQSQHDQQSIQSTPDPELRFFPFSKFLFGSPRGVMGFICISLLGLLLWSSLSSGTSQFELRNSDDEYENRESNSIVFPLYHKYENFDKVQRDLELKLGRFVQRNSVTSLGVNVIDDGIQQHPKMERLVSASAVDSSTIFTVQGNVYPHGLYYVSMFVGNPPKPYYLDMDTGSDLTWIQCDAPCTSCAKGPHPLYKPTKRNILPSKDHLCAQVQNNHNRGYCESCPQCDYEIEYADLSSSMGVLTKDEMQLMISNGTLLKPNIVLGCGYDQQGQLSDSPAKTDGILGLSRSKVSLPSQLASQGIIRNVVGHCISSSGKSDGYLFLGDELVPQWGMTWVPMLQSLSTDLYQTDIVKLNYGNGQLSLGGMDNSVGRVIFDSGSSYTYFSKKAYAGLLAALEFVGDELVRDDSDPTLPICWRAKSSISSVKDVKAFFKPVTFHFGSKWWIVSSKLQISPEGYLIISNKGNVCLGILDGSEVLDGSTIILGDISMRGQLVVYDNVNNKIGWAKSDCIKHQKHKSFPFF